MAIAVFQVSWLIIVWNTPTNTDSLCANTRSNCGREQVKNLQSSEREDSTTTATRREQELLHQKKIKCFLFVMILSSVDGRSRRDAIRSTWMLKYFLLQPKVIVKFLIGTLSLSSEQLQALTEENNEFEDLLLLKDLKESFNNLTRKVLTGFIHINQSYSYYYLFKGDDDTFIRLDILLNELSERVSHSKYYWGFFDGRSKPKKLGKYKETEWFVCDLYVPYALGGGYVLSGDLVSRITVNADGLKHYNSEDISVGLWLSGFDIERKHDVRFDTEYKSRGCQNVYLVSHKQSEQDMREKYKNIQTNNGKQCIEEKQVRGSYHYNWEVPPSQCCKRQNGIP